MSYQSTESSQKISTDEIDVITIFSIFLDNINKIFSVFLASLLVVTIYFFSAENIYQSNSLLEIKKEKSFLPDSLSGGFSQDIVNQDILTAEIEVYKSNNTVEDALAIFTAKNSSESEYLPKSPAEIRNNLFLNPDSNSLINISFTSKSKILSQEFLNILNEEFINDRKEFIKQSSKAGKDFIIKEIPRIQKLLKESEDNLNDFKVSTNTSDVIFNTNTRNLKLEELKNRLNEITFKELELKEFYKESHPIYLTLSEQKKLISSQVKDIESDLPNIPSTQRALENFQREVEIYSNVLKELSSQELSLSMTEASSLSNVRIINHASSAIKVSPSIFLFLISFAVSLIAYGYFFIEHYLGNKVTNFDSLIDAYGKEKIIGEFPKVDLREDKNKNNLSINIADEFLNKTIYEISKPEFAFSSFCILSTRKGAGKTEISRRLFDKLRDKYKVCLIDLDYRKKSLTRGLSDNKKYKNFEDFYIDKNNFLYENGSLFIPSFDIENPQVFFSSDEFKNEIIKLKEEFDFVLCDTPPWKLFIDAKIISELFDKYLYIVCNQLTTFRDIDIFLSEINDKNKVSFIYNKFNLYFNFLWFKYQYPYYSGSYYYDYLSYSGLKKNLLIDIFTLESFKNFYEYLKKIVKKIFKL